MACAGLHAEGQGEGEDEEDLEEAVANLVQQRDSVRASLQLLTS